MTEDDFDEVDLTPITVFSDAAVAELEKLIDDSDVVALLDPLLPAGGRPRRLRLRTLLLGLALVPASNHPLYLLQVHALLVALPAATRRRLGVSWTDAYGRDGQLTLRQVEHLYGLVTALVDGSAHFGNPEHTKEDRAQLDERLELITGLIIGASLPKDWDSNGHMAIDATFLDANSRPEATKRKKSIRKATDRAIAEGRATDLESLLADDDALARALKFPDFGADPHVDSIRLSKVRTSVRPPADPDASTISYKGELRHAYAAHLVVTIPSEADVAAGLAHDADVHAAKKADRPVKVPYPEPTPMLVYGMAMTRSTAAPGPAAVAITKRLTQGSDAAAAGFNPATTPSPALVPPGDTVADRGYSQSKPVNYHLPLKQLGRRLIFDLKHERGVTGSHRGAILAFGNLYSPGIRAYPHLLSDKGPSPFASYKEWSRYFKVAAARERFRLLTYGTPDGDGYARLGCPGVDRRGTLACPIKKTEAKAATTLRLEVLNPPSEKLDVCTTTKMTIPADVLARSMDLEWGSEAYYNSFIRRRPRVEGINGILKNPAFSALAHMRFRVRGRAKVTLFTAFAIAVTNLRSTANWRRRLARVRALNVAIAAAKWSRSPERTHTIEQLLRPTHRRRRKPAAARAP